MRKHIASLAVTHKAMAITEAKESPRFLNFDNLPDSAYVREAQLVRSPKRPDTPAPLPFSAPTLWRKVAAGTFPKPVKLSERVTCWRVSDVRSWMASRAEV